MTYQVVRQLQKEAIPVQQSCRVLDVGRSGYYDAQRRSAEPVVCKASVHLKAAFMASHQSYGSRRLVTAMANEGFHMGRYKVRSLMRQAALKPVWKRKFVHTTDSKHDRPIAANVLNRQFTPMAPNLAYVSDITYIRTGATTLLLPTDDLLAVTREFINPAVSRAGLIPRVPTHRKAFLMCRLDRFWSVRGD
jgi:putative transposase